MKYELQEVFNNFVTETIFKTTDFKFKHALKNKIIKYYLAK